MWFSSSKVLSGLERDVSFVLDVSVREPGTTTTYGQTSKSLLRNYELARSFGMKRTQIAAFSGGRYTVQDQFVETLSENGDDLSGCFVSFSVDKHSEEAVWKAQMYGIKNVFIDLSFSNGTGFDQDSAEERVENLFQIVKTLRSFMPGAAELSNGFPVGEIYINFMDFLENYHEAPQFFEKLFQDVSAQLDIQAACFEEYRGTGLPENIFNAAATLRNHFPFEKFKILAHIHGGNGLEDACNLAAALGGADGVWAGLVPTSAQSGHGTSLVYLTNLMRYGNKSVPKQYNLDLTSYIVEELYKSNFAGQEPIPLELPIIGRNANSLGFAEFSQNLGFSGMISNEVFGIRRNHRFVPLLHDIESVRQRIIEAGYKNATEDMAEDLIQKTQEWLLMDKYASGDTRIDFNSDEFIRSAFGDAGLQKICVEE